MKQINSLLICEVPKGSKRHEIGKSNGKDCVIWNYPLGWEYLPAPCSIIGLASEVGLIRKMQIVKWSGVNPQSDVKTEWSAFMGAYSFTSPTSDYLFLKIN